MLSGGGDGPVPCSCIKEVSYLELLYIHPYKKC